METQIEKNQHEILQLKMAMLKLTEQIEKMSSQINDLHSRPQSAIDQLILPQQVREKVEEESNEKVLQEEGLVEGYFYIRNEFPTGKVFYISKGTEKIIPTYNGVVYLGGNRAEGIPGKRYDILELTNKYFPKK